MRWPFLSRTETGTTTSGEVARSIRNSNYDGAKRAAGMFSDMFPGRFYLEVQEHGIPEMAGLTAQTGMTDSSMPIVQKRTLRSLR